MPPKTKQQPGPTPGELSIEYIPLDEIREADRNPKDHDTARIAGSISRFGFADAPILDERTKQLVAGHGRRADLIARRDAGQEPPVGIKLGPDGEWLVPVQRGWSSRSEEDAGAFLVGHNRIGELGGWNEGELADLLLDLGEADEDLLDAAGFTRDDIDEMSAGADAGEGVDLALATGQLLDIIDVTVAEPTAQTRRGDVWTLGRHRLVVARVMDEHHEWAHYLTDDTKLCPYPDPYLTHGTVARDNVLLLVQPSPYLAGHTVDKFRAAFPKEPVTLNGEAYTGEEA